MAESKNDAVVINQKDIDDMAETLLYATCYDTNCDDCKYDKYPATICCQVKALYDKGYRRFRLDSYKSGAEDMIQTVHDILMANDWEITPMIIGMICKKFGVSIDRRYDK